MESRAWGLPRVREAPTLFVNQFDLVYSFKPLLYLARIAGADLDVGQPRSKFRQRVSLILGILLHIYLSVGRMVEMFWDDDVVLRAHSTPSILDFLGVTSLIVELLIQPTIAISFYSKWKGLWQRVRQMEQVSRLPKTFYSQLRKMTLSLTTFIMLVKN